MAVSKADQMRLTESQNVPWGKKEKMTWQEVGFDMIQTWEDEI